MSLTISMSEFHPRMLRQKIEEANRKSHLEVSEDGGSACGQKEREALLAENASLKKRVEELEAENASLKENVKQLQATRRGSDEERFYLASNERSHFHRPNCEWAAYIPPYRLIEFSSHGEAVEAGYKPCKTCRA